MAGEHILIVDDEPAIRKALRGVLEDEGYRVSAVGTGADALQAVADEAPDLVFLDIWMPRMDGLETLAEIKRLRPDATVVMISGHGTIETAVKATRLGRLRLHREAAVAREDAAHGHPRPRARPAGARERHAARAARPSAPRSSARAAPMRALREQIATAAPSSGRVLIHGENGSGKELVARAIHTLSARADRPFVEVNCAAIPEELIESELFGHERGAFTGALARRRGRFELADGGTLFLDEIGDMSLKTQAKVLRALEEQAFERVGGTRDAAGSTSASSPPPTATWPSLIAQGGFREDLFYRLNVIPIEVPPLRDAQGGRAGPRRALHPRVLRRERQAAQGGRAGRR